jgi:hypothetical protein
MLALGDEAVAPPVSSTAVGRVERIVKPDGAVRAAEEGEKERQSSALEGRRRLRRKVHKQRQ